MTTALLLSCESIIISCAKRYTKRSSGDHKTRSQQKLFKIKNLLWRSFIKNGNTIYFTGSDSVDDTKGIIDEDKPIKYVIIDEVTEFFDSGEGEDELSNIEATFVRGNNEDFQMLYLFNPPKNPNAPVMEWCRKMEQREDTIHIHTDYRDVPVSWLGKKLIEAAEAMKALDEKALQLGMAWAVYWGR